MKLVAIFNKKIRHLQFLNRSLMSKCGQELVRQMHGARNLINNNTFTPDMALLATTTHDGHANLARIFRI